MLKNRGHTGIIKISESDWPSYNRIQVNPATLLNKPFGSFAKTVLK